MVTKDVPTAAALRVGVPLPLGLDLNPIPLPLGPPAADPVGRGALLPPPGADQLGGHGLRLRRLGEPTQVRSRDHEVQQPAIRPAQRLDMQSERGIG